MARPAAMAGTGELEVSDMVKAPPRIRYKGKEYFLDETRMELRPVLAPFGTIPIDDCDVCLFKHTCEYVCTRSRGSSRQQRGKNPVFNHDSQEVRTCA